MCARSIVIYMLSWPSQAPLGRRHEAHRRSTDAYVKALEAPRSDQGGLQNLANNALKRCWAIDVVIRASSAHSRTQMQRKSDVRAGPRPLLSPQPWRVVLRRSSDSTHTRTMLLLLLPLLLQLAGVIHTLHDQTKEASPLQVQTISPSWRPLLQVLPARVECARSVALPLFYLVWCIRQRRPLIQNRRTVFSHNISLPPFSRMT